MLGHWGVDVSLPLLACVSRQEGEEKRKKRKEEEEGKKERKKREIFQIWNFSKRKIKDNL
jgi:hypothetical protein